MAAEAFFLPAGPEQGERFCLLNAPGNETPRAALVYVHPFAEEMNKARRMAALQARAFVDAGYAVLQIDLHGCGDSSGDFADATWNGWVDDVLLACRWLRSRTGAPLWLWGLRVGCLLAGEAAGRLGQPSRLLLWQPVLAGQAALRQFLRLHTAGGMLSGAAAPSADGLRADLAAGKTIEVAGYRLAPALADGLERAELTCSDAVERVHWFELSTRDGAAVPPASSRLIERWRTSGRVVEARVVAGAAFWQSAEIEEAPALLRASLVAVRQEFSPP